MNVYVISDFESLQALSPRWDELAHSSDCHGLHMKFKWFCASCKVFNQHSPLHVVVVCDEDESVIGIAPLVITSGLYRGIRVKIIGFPNNPQTPYNNFILMHGREEECIKAIFEYLLSSKCWDLVDLRKVNGDSVSGQLMKTTLTNRADAFGVKENTESPYIQTDGDWPAFWQKKSKRFRKSMRQKLNRAHKAGNLVFEKVPITSSKAPELSEMRIVSSRSWKRTVGQDLLQHEKNWEFYQSICDLFGDGDTIVLWLLRKQNKAIAFEFHLNYNGVAYPIRADYDESYKELSPGSVLEHNIIKKLFEENHIYEYNTCGHTYNYLMNWTNLTRKHQNIELFSKSVKMSGLYCLEYKFLPYLRKMKVNKLHYRLRELVAK